MNKTGNFHRSINAVLILAVIFTFCFGIIGAEQADAATKKTHLQETKIVLLEGQAFTEKLISSSGKTISASKVKWTSSAKSVAKVSSKGVITAVADGTATITAAYSGKKYTAKVYVYDRMEADYGEIYDAAQAEHKELAIADMSGFDMKKYESPNPADKDLITDAEVKSLRAITDKLAGKVSAKDALNDIDLLFRTLKSAYAAYYYFGEENYIKAEENLVKWLSGKTTVKTDTLKEKIRKELDFMKDGSGFVGEAAEEVTGFKQEYFYCTNHQFARDEKGFYKTAKGKKWYFQAFTNDKASMEPSLTEDGSMTYSPVLLCPETGKKTCKIQLQDSRGNKRTEPVTWKQNEAYREETFSFPNVVYAKEDGIAYVAARAFWSQDSDEELKKFVESAKAAKDAEVLILDIRSNGDGSSNYPLDFFSSLTGEKPSYPATWLTRNSKLCDVPARMGYGNGGFLDNHIKMVVLTDDLCAAESCLLYAKAYDNVMVVGSNTAGHMLAPSTVQITLPASRITAAVPFMMQFIYEEKNLDGTGLMPDVWCSPAKALDSVFNMLEAEGVMDESTSDKLKASIAKQEKELALKNVIIDYTADAGEFCDGTSDYVYLKNAGKTVLKMKAEREEGKKVGGVILQISSEYPIKPTERTYRLDGNYGFQRKIDMLNIGRLEAGKTYYVRVSPVYIVDGKKQDGGACEAMSFTVQ